MIYIYPVSTCPKGFQGFYQDVCKELLKTEPIHTGEWQSMDTSKSPAHATYELLNFGFVNAPISPSPEMLALQVNPNLPWADEHFAERVGGIPFNPPPSHKNWPWARHNGNHQDANQKFSHTYPERFWPRYDWERPNEGELPGVTRRGIHYRYGDLSDVVDLLVRSPHTRQAYLPVWFPEDTGAHHGQRVPCTLGYHFMIREGKLNMTYYIRSCDIIRHFKDDVYLAGRLMQWMVDQVCDHWESVDHSQAPGSAYPVGAYPLEVGNLTMHIGSLHAFVGDKWKLEEIVANG